jgi:N-succinyl-L-ornithine transcarbamylase
MKNFTSINDVEDVAKLIHKAITIKKNPHNNAELGKNKTLGLLFFNASLRTRLSTQKAALNLGMNVIVMNINEEGWALEYEENAVMNGKTVEHIKDAATVMGLYCDVIALRCFSELKNVEEDYQEKILTQFMKYSNVPIVSMESATLHPLQSLADMMAIDEFKKTNQPKIVLTWAPHVKPLPQAVANSFAEWALHSGHNLTIVQPKGYELNECFTKGATIESDQQKALKDADFVYVKNWSSFSHYGEMPTVANDWMLTAEMLQVTNNAKVMHCLPVRRNVELSDEILDGPNSLKFAQAENRVYAAQAVLTTIIESINP